MRLWLARSLTTALVVQAPDGTLLPPGGGRAVRLVQPDDSEVALIARGDAFDFFIGKRHIYNLTLAPSVALRLAWWLICWWAFATWFGVKTAAWRWSQRTIMNSRL